MTVKVAIEERYKQIFEVHRYASEYRLKILATWGTIYATGAAIFLWTQSAAKPMSWVVTFVGSLLTLLLWAADWRNSVAIHHAKSVGISIEAEAGIPRDQRFFIGLKPGISHTWAIGAFATIMAILLLFATCYLLNSHGELRGEEPTVLI